MSWSTGPWACQTQVEMVLNVRQKQIGEASIRSKLLLAFNSHKDSVYHSVEQALTGMPAALRAVLLC